jgi:hypothetical protein
MTTKMMITQMNFRRREADRSPHKENSLERIKTNHNLFWVYRIEVHFTLQKRRLTKGKQTRERAKFAIWPGGNSFEISGNFREAWQNYRKAIETKGMGLAAGIFLSILFVYSSCL